MKPHTSDASLSRLQLFAELSASELQAIVEHSSTGTFPAGTKIIAEGEEGHCMYVLLDGHARVLAADHELARLATGDFFGEISLVDDGPRSADVVAETDCRVLTITRMTLGVLAGIQPDAAIHLLAAIGKSLVSKLRADNERFRELILLECRK
ncbi:MAG: hypothetical protein Fur0032_12050 [Terrimicrobiaceae bacterium]